MRPQHPEQQQTLDQPLAVVCARLAGRAVTRVVARCSDAQQSSRLDLSDCQLMQVPDAVYHLMRHTELQTCNLSSNVITKLPPKFAVKFSLITDLNLANNQMSRLPDELAQLNQLLHLDISQNSFTTLPHAVFKMPKLEILSAHSNYIIDVEVERLQAAPSLEEVDLQNNPLSGRTHTALEAITAPHIIVSVREVEDWEDLTI